MSIRIVPMTVDDIERCAELELELFGADDPWPAEAFRSELNARYNRYFTARDAADRLLGYAGVSLLGNSFFPEAEVHTIGVDPEGQRGGIGNLLLTTLLSEAGKRGGPVFLEVRSDNVAAIALYEKHGFEIVGLRKNYYQGSGADAFTMRRPDPRAGGGEASPEGHEEPAGSRETPADGRGLPAGGRENEVLS